ncbi:MAG: hypothetical protein H7Z16_05260 [Pyrinomonadaceae bacterium]|nr:hypothetical protein [Pyrinomonadaceae bacterium]
MKTNVSSIGCRDIRREIEEADQAEPLSSTVSGHLRACGQCETFYDEQLKLRQIVSSLSTVAAPNDFEFRLRARLASEKRNAGSRFTVANLRFGLRATAFATVLFLIGSALVVLSLRPATNDSFVANTSGSGANVDSTQPLSPMPPSATATDNENRPPPPLAAAAHRDDALASRTSGSNRRANRSGLRSNQIASVGNRVSTRDMSSTAAKVLKPNDLVAADHSVFPIDASTQALKVSLDNGRGSSKTISVPGVSFGSQRVATQNPSPLLASSRGAW